MLIRSKVKHKKKVFYDFFTNKVQEQENQATLLRIGFIREKI